MNVGFMVLKNGIRLGYPFIEAVTSVLSVVDAFLVIDHGSDDNTWETLQDFSKLNRKIHLERASWPQKSSCGSSIAVATNNGLKCCLKKWPNIHKILYLQADEVFHEKDLKNLGEMFPNEFRASSFHFLHFRNGFDHVISNPTYQRAIRIISPGARSILDGYNFENAGKTGNSHVTIFHVGWCFLRNICQKHVNHAALYPDSRPYLRAKKICSDMLATGQFSVDKLNTVIDQNYSFDRFDVNKLPAVLKHLLSLDLYNPRIGISVLGKRIKDS